MRAGSMSVVDLKVGLYNEHFTYTSGQLGDAKHKVFHLDWRHILIAKEDNTTLRD